GEDRRVDLVSVLVALLESESVHLGPSGAEPEGLVTVHEGGEADGLVAVLAQVTGEGGASRKYVWAWPGKRNSLPGPQCVRTPCRIPKTPLIRLPREGPQGELEENVLVMTVASFAISS